MGRPDQIALRNSDDEPGRDDRKARLAFFRCFHLASYFVRKPFVVVVEEGDPIAFRGANTDIPSFRAAQVQRKRDDVKSLITNRSESFLRSAVFSIDDDDDFYRRISLVKGAQDAFP